jgi:hypothetical protein
VLGGIAQATERIEIGQIGLDQEGFFRFYEREVLPKLSR